MAPKKTSASAVTAAQFAKMTKEEKILHVAARNMETYGTIDPPRDEIVGDQIKKCRGCGSAGRVKDLFGMFESKINGRIYANSYCTTCRNNKKRTPVKRIRLPRFPTDLGSKMTPKQIERYLELYREVMGAKA